MTMEALLTANNNNMPTGTVQTSYSGTQRYCTAPNVEIGESKTNLIINYLPQGMSQEEVRSLFTSIGEIESCKLVRDKVTGQSLGYGFVNYVREEDALRAVSSFNGLRLQNKTIKVSYARPSNDQIKGSNLYVSGIPKSMTLHELESIFRPFGQIITSRILSDNVTGLSKGVGFVRFDKKDEAEVAIKTLNGSVPSSCNEQITVKFANNPASNNPKGMLGELEAVQQAAALVPLSTILGAPTLRATGGIGPIHHAPIGSKYRYSPMGSITAAAATQQAAIPTDYLTTQALLQMSQLNALAGLTQFTTAAATVPDFTATFLAHQQQQQQQQQAGSPPATAPQVTGVAAQAQLAALSASLAATLPPSDTAGYCLFVYNLAADTDDTLLWQLFSPFGAILNVKILRDLSQKCKGYAFVSMSTYTEAYNALLSLNGATLAGKTLQVVFKSNTPYRT
uniref:RRM domain-containing protein n=1 Tax=Caenorhabditis japonica TaxID=281687 RepID=A0A8R1DMX6_CAEJA